MNETERKQKIWDEIIAEAKRNYPQKLEGEMSVTEFSRMSSLKRDYARRVLDDAVEAGTLQVRITPKARFYSAV